MKKKGVCVSVGLLLIFVSAQGQTCPQALSWRQEDSIVRAYRKTIPMPRNVLRLLDEEKGEEAKTAYKAFKDTLYEKDPFYVFFLDKEFVGKMAAYGAPEKERAHYRKLNEKMLLKMRKKYADRPMVIWYELDDLGENVGPEEILAVTERMIAADSTYLPAYLTRGMFLLYLGKTEEACRDFRRLPDWVQQETPECWICF